MKTLMFHHIPSRFRIHQLVLLLFVATLLVATGCSSSRYHSQRNWNRTPASTGHSRCGCLLTPSGNHTIKTYPLAVYALQA